MVSSFIHKEITEAQWIEKIKKIDSSTMTPWVRVSNNILHSLQWIGNDVVAKTERKYFGLIHKEEIICCVGIYFLSEKVIRARGFFCETLWRGQGLMKRCLEETLANYNLRAEKVLIFSPVLKMSFYEKCGFTPVRSHAIRPLEYFDFENSSYV